MSLPAAAVRRPIATTMLLITAVVLGLTALPRLEMTLLPDLRSTGLTVWVPVPDAGVDEIESSVVRPVESQLVTVRGVRSLETEIVPGGARIECRLYPAADPDLVTLGLRERLDAVRWLLPVGVERPVILGSDALDRPALVLALAGDDLVAASDWAETVLRPRLEQIEGVARAAVVGAPEREVRVLPDLDALSALGLGVRELAAAIDDANVDSPGGVLKRRDIRFAVELDSRLRDARDVADVVLARRGATTVRVRDVARVIDGHADPDGWSRLDGAPAVGILVTRESGANLIEMADAVHARLAEITLEFPDVRVEIVADASPYVRQSIGGVWQAVWLGGILAYLVLLAFLRDLRSPLVLMVALPVSVIVSFAVLDLLGRSLNLMSLGGIALGVGMLVDNGIICLENIHRLRREGLSARAAAAEGAREVALPILGLDPHHLCGLRPAGPHPGAGGRTLPRPGDFDRGLARGESWWWP